MKMWTLRDAISYVSGDFPIDTEDEAYVKISAAIRACVPADDPNERSPDETLSYRATVRNATLAEVRANIEKYLGAKE